MRYEERITVSQYRDEIYEQLGYYQSNMVSAKDYAKQILLESLVEHHQTSLITVQEYMAALTEVGYAKTDAELEAKIEEYLANKNSKSYKNAKVVERLLA